jgi:uncharacterized OB-fold protein
VRGIERAAAYVPAASDGVRRRAAWDEDPFTLAATALERLESVSAAPIARLLIAGDLPPDAEAPIARFLGYDVPTARCGPGSGGRAAAIRAALAPDAPAGSTVVLSVDLVISPRDRLAAPPSDSATAVAIGEGGPIDAAPLDREDGHGGSGANGAIFARLGSIAPSDPARWVGDLVFDPARGPPAGPPSGPLPASGTPVSQGAHVPRPRYLEQTASRWRFMAERCTSCGDLSFPPRGRCRACERTGTGEPVRLPVDGGRVVASTVIRAGGQPTEFDDQVAALGPYGVAIVELAPDVRVTLPVAPGRSPTVEIGSLVVTRLRRLYPMEGEWRYGRKVVPS